MINAEGTSARYLVAYKVGQGIVWMVPVNSNDTLPQRGRFLYEQIWTYGAQAVTVRSAEDGDVLFRVSDTGTGIAAEDVPHLFDSFWQGFGGGAHGAGLGGLEERRARPLQEGGERDHPEGDVSGHDRRRERGHRHEPEDVGGDHQGPAVPAVGDEARGQSEHGARGEACETDDPGLCRRPREGEHEERVGDRRNLRSRLREQLPQLQEQEVPVAPKRREARAHGWTTLAEGAPGAAHAAGHPRPPRGRPARHEL